MAPYRYQVVCASLWRGKIKRWNTTFHMTRSDQTLALRNIMQASCYPNPGDVVGAASGGVASIACYAPTGGAPISRTVFFDYMAPGTWIPYTGSVWASVPPDTPLDASGESAALIVGNLSALSSTGKPVTTRKYIHAVPSRTAADFSDPDIDAATISALKAQFVAIAMLSPSGATPTSVDVEPYYGNHQRVRGRRRTTKQVAANSFSAGVVAGSGAPFPEPRVEFVNNR